MIGPGEGCFSISNTKCSTTPERLEVRCTLRLPAHEGAGRVGQRRGVVPGPAPSCEDGWLLRVATRPGSAVLSRLGNQRSSRAHQAISTARGLSSMPDRRFRVQGFLTEPPWTLRFLSPEAYWLKVRFASQPDAGLQVLLLGRAPVVTGLLEEDRAGDI